MHISVGGGRRGRPGPALEIALPPFHRASLIIVENEAECVYERVAPLHRYFVAVERTFNMRHAAEDFRLAQPALSHSIRQLEQELGVELLARRKKHLSLTKTGKLS